MAVEWFYMRAGQIVGPLTAAQLREHALVKKITSTDHVRHGVDGNWMLASKVKGLFDPTPAEKESPGREPGPAAVIEDAPVALRKRWPWYASGALMVVVLVGLVVWVSWRFAQATKASAQRSARAPHRGQVVVGASVVTTGSDMGQRSPMLDQVHERLDVYPAEALDEANATGLARAARTKRPGTKGERSALVGCTEKRAACPITSCRIKRYFGVPLWMACTDVERFTASQTNQQADGSVVIPEVLRRWVGKERIGPRL